ncbi:MAG: mandelate racemase/muconate lactonizing enzyme family protein [Candidatus Bathyarchaeia archaeon]
MEIVSMETVLLSCPVPKEQQLNWDGAAFGQRVIKNDMMIIKLRSDEGIEGIGEPSVYGDVKFMDSWLRERKSMFIGRDPYDALKNTQPQVYYDWRVNCALAGVNQALWDIIGKANREKVKAAREGLGKDLHLMVEWNERIPNARVAANAIRNIERYEITWIEEPLRKTDIEGYAELRRLIDTLVSGGESLATRWEFKERLEKGCYSIVQPDCNVAGISEARIIALMASLDEVLLCPHNWHNAINTAANLQVMAASPNQFFLEINKTWNNSCPEFQQEIIKDPLVPKNGYIEVPGKPGLGVELDEEALKEFPYLDIKRAEPI